MKYLLDIKTFIRADDAMLDLLLPQVTTGYHFKDHWAIWLIPTNKVTTEVKEWLGYQPANSYDTCRYIGFVDGLKSCNADETTYATYLAVGVSLSMLTRDQIQRLIRSKGSLSIVEADVTLPGYDATKNPNLFTQGSKGFMYTSRRKVEYVKIEVPPPDESKMALAQKFLDSLEGHDFWYDYSDSLSVYKAGKARADDLKRAGRELGLTAVEVENLYNQKYKELMKR